MNALQMQIEFERLLYTSNPEFSTSGKLDTDEIFAYLNIAQLRVMKQKYFPTSNITENVKVIQSNVEELRNLIKRSTVSPGTALTTVLHAYPVVFPNDYLHYIRSDSSITRTALPVINSASIVPNKVIDYSMVDLVTTHAFNKPILRKPCVVFEENATMIVYIDTYTVLGDVTFTYLKTPLTIKLGGSNDCELAEYLHEEIVATAVDIFRREKYLLITKKDSNESRGNA